MLCLLDLASGLKTLKIFRPGCLFILRRRWQSSALTWGSPEYITPKKLVFVTKPTWMTLHPPSPSLLFPHSLFSHRYFFLLHPHVSPSLLSLFSKLRIFIFSFSSCLPLSLFFFLFLPALVFNSLEYWLFIPSFWRVFIWWKELWGLGGQESGTCWWKDKRKKGLKDPAGHWEGRKEWGSGVFISERKAASAFQELVCLRGGRSGWSGWGRLSILGGRVHISPAHGSKWYQSATMKGCMSLSCHWYKRTDAHSEGNIYSVHQYT